MGREIFNIKGMAEAIRYTEYKNIYSAISELIDNSIEAKAKNIIISLKYYQRKGEETIEELAVLDDGYGMDDVILQDCLVFGSTTKQNRESMGRFGVGLGQASLFAAPRVEVYSWQNSNNPKFVYLDTEQMKEGKQKTIPAPIEKTPPEEFFNSNSIRYFGGRHTTNIIDYSISGTMILWRDIDTISVKLSTFKKRLHEEIGRKFRYYIRDGVNIFLTDTAFSEFEKINLIDPMFLMESSMILGDIKNNTMIANGTDGEPIFEPFVIDEENDSNEYTIKVRLDKKNEITIFGEVVIRASVVKEKFYYGNSFNHSKSSNPGDTEIGKRLKKYENISVLRAGREIQFEKAGLYDSVNTPTNRWWSIEVEFTPNLDEFFKLSNNKQKVEFEVGHYEAYLQRKKKDKAYSVEHNGDIEEVYWVNIVQEIKSTIRKMTSRNSKIAREYSGKKDDSKNKDNIVDVVKPYTKVKNEDPIDKNKKLKDIFEDALSEKLFKNFQTGYKELVVSESANLLGSLFTFEEDSNYELVAKVDYDHEYFKVKDYIKNVDIDKVLINILVHSFSKVGNNMSTHNKRIIFDDFVKQLNNEIDNTLKTLQKGDINDESKKED